MQPDVDTAQTGAGIQLDPGGSLQFHGAAREFFGAIDAGLAGLAREAGALPWSPPATISRESLDRAGYFQAFADTAVAATEAAAFLPPAACYHLYAAWRDRRVDDECLVTLATTCARHEARAADDAGRLRQFRMREVVFIGRPDWIAATRDDWMARASAFAASMGLAGSLEPATDMFFGNQGRGRRLIQQVRQLKFELRMDAGRFGRLAVASFNLHETFFGSRFGITLADGSVASSGCAAFGIERWTLASLAQRGAHVSQPSRPERSERE
jgi:seryl-tRNA synthetase